MSRKARIGTLIVLMTVFAVVVAACGDDGGTPTDSGTGDGATDGGTDGGGADGGDGSNGTEAAGDAFTAGQQAAVPLMIGYNSDEGTLLRELMNPAGAEFTPPVPPGLEVTNEPTPITPESVRSDLDRSYPSAQHVDRFILECVELGDLAHCLVGVVWR